MLIAKRLEDGAFAWPKVADGVWPKVAVGVMRLSPAQLSAQIEGLDRRRVRAERPIRPRLAG